MRFPILLTDEAFRRLVARLDDPVALGPFWSTFESWSTAERTTAIGPVMNKLRAILMRKRVRNIVGQGNPALDFTDIFASGKVVLVSLAKGLLGDDASRLLGSLVVALIWQATLARAALPATERRPLFLYIDEVQDYLRLGDSVGDLLAQARGLGLGLVAAHQHLGKLPTSLRTAMLSNARTKVVWQTGADDARLMAREFAPQLTAEDLRGLDRYEVALRVCVAGRVSDPTIGRDNCGGELFVSDTEGSVIVLECRTCGVVVRLTPKDETPWYEPGIVPFDDHDRRWPT